ncbi:Pyruvate decarboxylase [Acidisarcina polymorpha]|uniref:Pyruvate decarboxylase n=1 Tax=Acidisarcina polymorpha TaxID=2211140 RepID=A0A2Z5G8I0_9BACT|nr:thiamine pyrophosphate-binding protein [Acidisarcina polymorpha]AXC15289.1 Pyruvate decarboxylase [Acidisarcina polymorpha]
MTVTEYIMVRLQELGVDHVFGVPGDFNLSLLEQVTTAGEFTFVGCCNELNASYAADGYARVRGMSALVTTYGVGELSALAGVAGAYAEKVPIVCINGTPPLRAVENGALIHHTMADGNYSNMLNCYRNFTVAQALLTPANAGEEIDRVLLACVSKSRPVYLQIPSDVAGAEIGRRPQSLNLDTVGDAAATALAVETITERLNRAHKPAILVDADIGRFKLLEMALSLAERRGLPIAYLIPAKGLIPESHPNVIGIYRGAASSPDVLDAVEGADCLICIGARFTDVATGLFSQNLRKQNLIDVQSDHVAGDNFFFDNIRVAQVLERITEAGETSIRRFNRVDHALPPHRSTYADSASVNQDSFWQLIQTFLKPGDIIVSDTGTAFFACSQLDFPEQTNFLGQPIWSALGYGVPACLGACCAAPSRRVLLFVGDGGLQMSVQELSTLFRLGLKPIIFLLNNDGYTIERLIYGAGSVYNDLQPWDYPLLPRVFSPSGGCAVKTVRTNNEVHEALNSTAGNDTLQFIEVILPRLDAAQPLSRFLQRVAEFNFSDAGVEA